MASNASHMLEAALEQMDDIIAGKRSLLMLSEIQKTSQFVIAGLRKTRYIHMIWVRVLHIFA